MCGFCHTWSLNSAAPSGGQNEVGFAPAMDHFILFLGNQI